MRSFRPTNSGQAARIPGLRAPDLTILHIHLAKRAREAARESA